jgi:hypothetical protein
MISKDADISSEHAYSVEPQGLCVQRSLGDMASQSEVTVSDCYRGRFRGNQGAKEAHVHTHG